MSASERNINEHPINQAAKYHIDRLGIAVESKSAHIITLTWALIGSYGLDYNMDQEHIINTYMDKLSWRLDEGVIEFLLREVDPEYVDQFCEEIRSMTHESELKDHIIDELLIPAFQHEYDGPFIKQYKTE
ncbi:hypothetical protein [Gracilimonas sp.]|uniref:hypothetical protein n=1 Tax=Gracilimonas sp. TaxID=1974203 RepID=UPI003D12A4A9